MTGQDLHESSTFMAGTSGFFPTTVSWVQEVRRGVTLIEAREPLMIDSNPTESEEPDPRPGRDVPEEATQESYELEPEPAAPDSSSVAGVSDPGDRRCERCGAPLPEDPTLTPCPSCGFDAETGTVVDPDRPPEDSVDELDLDEGEEASKSPLLFASGRPTPWLVASGVLALIVVFAMLAGWSSFYPRSEGRFLDGSGDAVLDSPMVTIRLVAVAKYLVGSLVLVGTALIAARFTCWFEDVRPGDLRTGAARIGLVVIGASLVRLIGFQPQFLQTMTQLVFGAGIVVGATILVLGRRDRTIAMFLMAWVLVVLLVIPVTRLVSWSLPLW